MNTCRECGSEEVVSIQYDHNNPNYYDGISEYKCFNCSVRIGRWSGKILGDDEQEKPYGGTV